MNEKILKLIKEYKRREEFLTTVIIELQSHSPPNQSQREELKTAKNTRAIWRVVIKDLEQIIR